MTLNDFIEEKNKAWFEMLNGTYGIEDSRRFLRAALREVAEKTVERIVGDHTPDDEGNPYTWGAILETVQAWIGTNDQPKP